MMILLETDSCMWAYAFSFSFRQSLELLLRTRPVYHIGAGPSSIFEKIFGPVFLQAALSLWFV